MKNFVSETANALLIAAFAILVAGASTGAIAHETAAPSVTVAEVTEHNAIEQEEDTSQMPTQDPGSASTAQAPAPQAAPSNPGVDPEIHEMHEEFPQTEYPPHDD